jgi:sec-independent protein translocase protein TatB
MPQIGWFEILIIVVMAIIIVGPKDFPIILKKIGSWTGYLKSYFIEVQRDVSDMENSIEEDFNIEEDSLNKKKEIKKKDE